MKKFLFEMFSSKNKKYEAFDQQKIPNLYSKPNDFN